MPTFAALDRFVIQELNVQRSFEEHEQLQHHFSVDKKGSK
jgi:hypothetical protein